NRVPFFGEIKNGIMGLNEMGCIAAAFWQEIPLHYPNVFLDEWIIMPDHIHGIIIIDNVIPPPVGAGHCPAPTGFAYYGQLSKTIKSFKEACTKKIRQKAGGAGFGWQRSFYDHIIRDERSLNAIRRYIQKNPMKWDGDRNEPKILRLI